MNKQLTVRDYIWSIVFFLLLVCIVAAFFLGVKVGKDTTEKRFEHLVSEPETIPDEWESYDQQYLVSFYHTIYSPWREFKFKWFEHMEAIALGNPTQEASALLRELERLAHKQYEEIEIANIPQTSSKLREAQDHYLKSLHLFGEALGKNDLQRLHGEELLHALEQDPFVTEARTYALQAQEDYYEAIVHWHRASDENVQFADMTEEIPLTQWRDLPLTVKNWLVAALMNENELFTTVYPQDVSINIDALIEGGQAEQMNVATVSETVDMLIVTRGVRTNDFAGQMKRFYSNETLPQLPFFLIDDKS